LPSLEGYFEEAIEQIDPAAMVEEEYKYVGKVTFRLNVSHTFSLNLMNSESRYGLQADLKGVAKCDWIV
jgi:hypothetical protein